MTTNRYGDERSPTPSRSKPSSTSGLGSKPNTENFLKPLNELHRVIGSIENKATLWKLVHTDAALKEEADAALATVSSMTARLDINKAHSEAVNAIYTTALDGPTKRLVEKLRDGYKRNGAELSDADKVRCVAMREELSKCDEEFEDNITNDPRFIEISPEQLDGLPQDYQDAHPPAANGKVKITTAYSDRIPFRIFAKSDDARFGEAPRVPSFAAYQLADESIKTERAAERFIIGTADAVKETADLMSDRLVKVLQKEQPDIKELTRWRRAYSENQLTKQVLHGFDEGVIRPYLRSSQVKKGIFSLLEHNFKIKLEKVEGAPAWHEDVELFDALDMANGGQPMGEIYLDLHPRDGKYSHACCYAITRGVPGVQPPRCFVVCNFPREEGGKDALYAFDEVRTFLHNIFLGVHILCAQSPWYKLSSCEEDFNEVPSQVIENWMFDKGYLRTFAIDASGRTIPDEYIDALTRREELERAIQTRRQMAFSLVSLKLHQLPLSETGQLMADPNDVFEESVRRVGDLPIAKDTYFLNSFSHLCKYHARYYGYMWAQSINRDVLSAFAGNLMNPEVAMRFRRCILEKGGSVPAMELVADFLGRPFSTDEFHKGGQA